VTKPVAMRRILLSALREERAFLTITAQTWIYFHNLGGSLGSGRSRNDCSALAQCPNNNPPARNAVVSATATRCQGPENLITAWIPINKNEHPNRHQESFHRLRLSRTKSASTPCRSSRCLCCQRPSHSHIREDPQVTGGESSIPIPAIIAHVSPQCVQVALDGSPQNTPFGKSLR
jgi:hypothetical protein